MASEHGMTIHAAEVMPDHVHLFMESDPTLCVGRDREPLQRPVKSHFAKNSLAPVPLADAVEPQLFRIDRWCGLGSTIRRYIEVQKGT